MFGLFITFVITGGFLGFIFDSEEKSKVGLGVILLITLLWAFVAGPWAIATLIELLLGFAIVRKLMATKP
jgi:hypothetical protein